MLQHSAQFAIKVERDIKVNGLRNLEIDIYMHIYVYIVNLLLIQMPKKFNEEDSPNSASA